MEVKTGWQHLFLCIFSVLLSYELVFSSGSVGRDLVLVQVLYRHGDRSPVHGYPKNNFTESEWNKFGAQGYGQLTWRGMEQQYQLGKFFRKVYVEQKKFLNENYQRKELHVRSTDVDRTLMSAYCNLAGMYPPPAEKSTSPWDVNHTINWQPIPVHTVPQMQDNLLDMDAKCARADELYQKEQATAKYINYTNQYKDFFNFLSEKTGMRHEDLDNLWETIDTLYCEKQHNVTLPSWSQSVMYKWNKKNVTVYDLLMSLQTWEFDLKYGEPAEKARLRGGPLLKAMIENMGVKINGTTNQDMKIYMYSAHDNTVVALLNALKVYNKLLPEYTATVILELYHNNSTKGYEVHLQYKNETKNPDKVYDLTIPGCTLYCPYNKFINLTASMIPDDWKTECMMKKPSTINQKMIIGIGVGGGVLLTLGLIGLVFCMRKQRRSSDEGYYGINNADA